MMRELLVTFALLVSVLLPAPVLGAEPTLITVTGDARVFATPDTATMGLLITTNSESATTATSENNAIYNRLVAALEPLGISKTDIQTQYYNLGYNPRPATPVQYPQRYGYTVSRNINVTIRKTGIVGEAVDAAVASGVNNVQGVSFGLSDNHPFFLRALGFAVAQARSRAEAIAQSAGLKIVRVRAIQEGYVQTPVPVMRALAGVAPAPVPTEISPTDVSVQATVTATYEASP